MPATLNSSATLVWNGPKHVPHLTPGKLSLEIISLWNNAGQHYFHHKELVDVKRVISVVGSFDDPLIQHWFNNNLTLTLLPFSDFLNIFKDRWLKKNWADNVLTRLICSHQDEKDHFEDWVVSLEHVNLLLEGTPGFYDNTRLRHHISANVVRELHLAATCAKILKIEDYKDWKEALADVNARHIEECSLRYKDFEKILNDRTCSAGNTRATMSGSSCVVLDYHSSNPGGIISTSSTSRPLVSSSSTCVPPLTVDERKILHKNNGCYKCRVIFANHSATDCTNGFPNPNMYKTLTTNDIKKASTLCASTKVAAVTSSFAEFSDVTNTYAPSGTIAAMQPLSPYVVCSSVLSSGNDSSESECILSDFFTPHIYWSAVIHSTTSISIPIPMLINCGSPTVLIRASLVADLGLCCF